MSRGDIKLVEQYFSRIGYVPSIGQMEVHNSSARYRVVVAGRRWGKSTLAGHEVSYEALKPGVVVWIVSKTYELGEKVYRVAWDDIVNRLGFGLVRSSYSVASGSMRFETEWGSRLVVKSADHKDSLVGEGIDFLVFDECALCEDDVWERYLMPGLVGRGGRVLFISTPRGINWYYDLYRMGLGSDHEWQSFHYRSDEGSMLSAEELEIIRSQVSEYTFRREYMSEFLEGGGLVYSRYTVIDEEHDFIRRYRGIDVGYENPFVCLYIGETVDGKLVVYDEVYGRRMGINEIMEQLDSKRRNRSEEYEMTYCDGSARWFIGELEERGEAVVGVRGSVVDGVERLRGMFESGTVLIHRRCENLLSELGKYRYESGERIIKEDDHGPDALRYVITGIGRVGSSSGIILPGGEYV